ncbi:methyltransferase family protein [Hymenobacter jejuensis]|uniref:Isoprenylcysteine carboxylmethyltransferase family protein n=1 Tax=Hymenobacter jejuensis TaxID=2502781 RepID=A0A5B8A0W0_9BACT|nr:isoprenylcysteine carboxylmethyltransferase family protein [Hymenobacter jejuensis]QDA60335.1 isoprenylcysteine carboxylmethyltransferase family protein [Hymenobacter jejuensis]
MKSSFIHKDSPGVVVPPPFLYVLIFLAAFLLQRWLLPLDDALWQHMSVKVLGGAFCIAAFALLVSAVTQFQRTHNTVVTVHRANSLQTTGVYHLTRNPMYLALLLLYAGLACLVGGWWHLILLPLLILIVQEFVIKHEEHYLEQAFGQQYRDYKHTTRRWL